ncbi:MFS transporter [Colwellia sp. MB02u-18]|uniref:MFS transporter n=1 Tax=unclassified Colwellia TaxID=196834 RepID=UPI0015F52E64|nr:MULTISPECIES: MFS transporter [unclassified Colwellia]MBA6223542.1 MFS transporter [Colwellia sp. MB3u-45]MBA6269101.1 MFS transporter [Colwellia sp. MB3u-43]MBA6320813.1 MFS transporter [Colwellia sp. MB02u-19]MBA6324025.1 MFS transporter [Colwellia sp. MB02u-18]MBA6330961.1 MFS transporter [Colwellia sp. MB02u-12]
MKITNKYLVEAIVFFSYVLFAMAWVGGTASMQSIMLTLDVHSLASASFISGAVTLAKIVGTFIAAWIAIKLGIKYAFFVASLLITIGLLTPYAPNYEWLLLSRFLMGLGGAFMVVYFNPIVLQFFKAEERSTINGINAVAFNMGTAIILWQMQSINQLTGSWQNSLTLFSVLSLAVALLWLLVKFEQPSRASRDQNALSESYTYRQGLTDRFNWLYGLAYSGILAFYICLFTFYPKAGIVQSKWVIGFGIVGTIFGIIYSKKVPLRLPVIRWSGLVVIISTAVFSFSDLYWLQTFAAMVLGFFIFLPVTALVSIPHELPKMTSARITIIFSMFYSISYIISTIILWVFGRLVDINQGDYTGSFILITVLSSTLFIGSYFLPETGHKTKIQQQGS